MEDNVSINVGDWLEYGPCNAKILVIFISVKESINTVYPIIPVVHKYSPLICENFYCKVLIRCPFNVVQ